MQDKDFWHEYQCMEMYIGQILNYHHLNCKVSTKQRIFDDYKIKFMEYQMILGIYINGDLQYKSIKQLPTRKYHYIITQLKYIDCMIN